MLLAGKRRGRQLLQQSGTRGCVPSIGRCQKETGQETSNPPIRCGAYLKRSNADYVKSITRKKKSETPQTQSKVWDTYNVIAQSYNSR